MILCIMSRWSAVANHGQCETHKHKGEWPEGKQQHILLRSCGLSLFVRVWRDVTFMFVTALFKVRSAQKAHYEVNRFSRLALFEIAGDQMAPLDSRCQLRSLRA